MSAADVNEDTVHIAQKEDAVDSVETAQETKDNSFSERKKAGHVMLRCLIPTKKSYHSPQNYLMR